MDSDTSPRHYVRVTFEHEDMPDRFHDLADAAAMPGETWELVEKETDEVVEKYER